jgi:hypothetical protein
MRKNLTQKHRDIFLAQIRTLLLSLGAEQKGDDFLLQTKAGNLTVHPDPHETEGLGTVFARFDDSKAAIQLVGCNKFSGKWNFSYFCGWTVQTAVEDYRNQLRKVLAQKNTILRFEAAVLLDDGEQQTNKIKNPSNRHGE